MTIQLICHDKAEQPDKKIKTANNSNNKNAGYFISNSSF